MPVEKLPNYVRGARKSIGFSQKELAYLLGTETAGQVSRYERFERTPNLVSAILLSEILQRPVTELFAGLRHQGRARLAKRAESLLASLEKRSKSGGTAAKLTALRAIARSKPVTKHKSP